MTSFNSFLIHPPTPHKVMWFPWTECLIWILVDRTSRAQTIASWINNCRVSKRGHSLWLARWLLQLHSSVHSSPILIERQKADAWTLNYKYGMRCIRVLAAATLCFHLRHSTTAAPWRLAGQSPFKSVLVSLHFKRSTRKRNTKIRIKTRIGNNCWVACRHLASFSVLLFLGSSPIQSLMIDAIIMSWPASCWLIPDSIWPNVTPPCQPLKQIRPCLIPLKIPVLISRIGLSHKLAKWLHINRPGAVAGPRGQYQWNSTKQQDQDLQQRISCHAETQNNLWIDTIWPNNIIRLPYVIPRYLGMDALDTSFASC